MLGRISELCKPTQRKYDLAVEVVLGRHLDSIVVDTEATAVACIQVRDLETVTTPFLIWLQDMRNAQSGIATFLPLDTMQVKQINDKYRHLSRNARLAVDLITFEPNVEKALHFACGNALICDTTDVAKYICYEKNEEVKGQYQR